MLLEEWREGAMRRANVFVYDECINQGITFPELPVFLAEHFGQCAEDLIVASLLLAWSKRVGVAFPRLRYLEIGGNHPIATSATFLLNQKFGMRGVIVEANPALIHRLRKFRPDDVIVHGAVQAEAVATVDFSVSNQSEVSSLDRSFVLAWHGGEVGERALISVPALRINEIIETHFPSDPPAYLSIDVEGMDLKVLEDLDIVRFRPVIVQAEPSDQHIPENSLHMKELMAARGYVLIAQTEVNLIFMAIECIDSGLQNASANNAGPQSVTHEGALLATTSQLEASRAEISQVRQQLVASAAEVQAREAMLRLLYKSRSWRVTAPLRALTRALRLNSKPKIHAMPVAQSMASQVHGTADEIPSTAGEDSKHDRAL